MPTETQFNPNRREKKDEMRPDWSCCIFLKLSKALGKGGKTICGTGENQGVALQALVQAESLALSGARDEGARCWTERCV